MPKSTLSNSGFEGISEKVLFQWFLLKLYRHRCAACGKQLKPEELDLHHNWTPDKVWMGAEQLGDVLPLHSFCHAVFEFLRSHLANAFKRYIRVARNNAPELRIEEGKVTEDGETLRVRLEEIKEAGENYGHDLRGRIWQAKEELGKA